MTEKTLLVADYLRREAEWRRSVAQRHADEDSARQAHKLDRAADAVEVMDDDEELIQAMSRRGMFAGGRFTPSQDVKVVARRFGRGQRTSERSQHLFARLLAHCLTDDEIEQWARRVQGKCGKLGLRLVASSRTVSDLPRFLSYRVVTSLGVHVLGDDSAPRSLADIETYLDERASASTVR